MSCSTNMRNTRATRAEEVSCELRTSGATWAVRATGVACLFGMQPGSGDATWVWPILIHALAAILKAFGLLSNFLQQENDHDWLNDHWKSREKQFSPDTGVRIKGVGGDLALPILTREINSMPQGRANESIAVAEDFHAT